MKFILIFCGTLIRLGLTADNNSCYSNCEDVNYLRRELHWIEEISNTINLKRIKFENIYRQGYVATDGVPRKDDRSHYLESFYNSYFLVRRLIWGWSLMRPFMVANFGREVRTPFLSVNRTYVWTSTMKSLVRLQETYNISTEDMASGKMRNNNNHTQAQFTARDCMDVGLFYYQMRYPARAVEWFLAAQRRAVGDTTVSKERIMEYLYLANCFKGDNKGSRDILIQLQKDFPSFRPSDDLGDDHKLVSTTPCHELAVKTGEALKKNKFVSYYHQNFSTLCRKENYRPPNDRRLKCRLLHYNQPQLMIQPYKIEELHLDPPILLIHEAIQDNKANLLMQYKKRRGARSKGGWYKDHNPSDPNYVQTFVWMPNKDNKIPVGRSMLLKSASISNVNPHLATRVLISHYGLAGDLRLHCDTEEATDDYIDQKVKADYASVLYYLNDVADGGYTVFPVLGLAVPPVKGSALFFFNRYPNGFPIPELLHTGCPVLEGSKWLVVVWLHAFGQDFPKCRLGKEKTHKYTYLRA